MTNSLHNEIPIALVGCDFRIAPTALREKLMTTPRERTELVESIRKMDNDAGLLVLETCNRNEWIISSSIPEWIAELLSAKMLHCRQKHFPDCNLPDPYVYIGKESVKHILRVVLGMESLATGEAQIAGQFQRAVKQAQLEQTSSSILNMLSAVAGRIAKAGYKLGFRSDHQQGIHGLTVRFLENYFQEVCCDKKIIVMGMGEIGRKTAFLVEERLQCKVIRLNRTVKPQHKNIWHPLHALKDLSSQADVLITSTGSVNPIVKKDDINCRDDGRKLLIMDLGIPRQVEADVGKMEHTDYRTIDDLMDLNDDAEKTGYIDMLERKIERAAMRFRRYCAESEMAFLLNALHQKRQEFVRKFIPAYIQEKLGDMNEKDRKKIETAMKQVISEYSNDVFTSIHETLEG